MNKKAFQLLLLIACVASGFAEENFFKIKSASVKTDEKTSEFFVRGFLKVDFEQKFTEEELSRYVNLLKKKLEDKKIFSKVEILQNALPPDDDDDFIPVELQISLETGKNLFFFPGPKYSSSSGLMLKVFFRGNNFFGTMNSCNFDTAYIYDSERKENGVNFKIDLPFLIPLKKWDFSIDAFSDAQFFSEEDSNLKSSAKFSFLRHFGVFSLKFGFLQGFTKNPDFREQSNELFLTESAFVEIPFAPFSLKSGSPVEFALGFSAMTNIALDDNARAKDLGLNVKELYSPKTSVFARFSTKSIEQKNGLRQGFSCNITEDFSWNFHSDLLTKERFDSSTQIEGTFFAALSRAGFCARGIFVADTQRYLTTKVGKNLRGILDYEMGHGFQTLEFQHGFVFNFDFPILVIDTNFAQKEKSLLKKFDAQFFVSPFFDMAFGCNENPESRTAYSQGVFTSGMEFLLTPKRWSFVTMRISLGVNLTRFTPNASEICKNDSLFEIFLGTGILY